MSVTTVLLHILVVLLAAKAAAEVAERVGGPAVVGEILAGVLIGPSVLGLVEGDEVLRVLGELGVILLLLEVGLQMDLADLGAVGRASMAVATIGVVAPFAAGYAVGLGFGMSGNEALFVGAALTATSVGITARVFGDLRALPTVEARTVLGAAVADDVMGLVILTVVVRLVSQGSVSLPAVAGILAVAIGFLLLTTFVGVRGAPALFAAVARHSRSSGTLVAVALAFTLAVSELASAAKLAPIVGAFVAGVSLARSPAAERIRRELTPVGHLFVPVFFLQIGIDADVGQFARPAVLGLAAALLAVAVVGKLAAAWGLLRSPGDRLLVGIGMVPRGEVGLIFATLGLRQHVFGEDVYAALLLVVLATTLLPPPALRWRLLHLRSRPAPGRAVATRPAGGWLRVEPGLAGATVELVAEPLPPAALAVALEAARVGDRARPGTALMAWLGRLPDGPLHWDRAARERFFELLRDGGPRAWRFLALTGVLDRALPELAQALARRQADASELDPTSALRWPRLGRLHELAAGAEPLALQHPERVHLAAVVLDAVEDEEPPVPVARRLVQRLDLGAAAEQAVAGLVGDANLLSAVSRRFDALSQATIEQLAVHLGSSEQAQALSLLTRASEDLDAFERDRLAAVVELVQESLAHPELTGREVRNAVERRRAEATRLTTDDAVRQRITATPRAHVLVVTPADLARQAALCEPPLGRSSVRTATAALAEPDQWRIEIVARDRVGLLASEARTLSDAGLDVVEAAVATWGDGCAVGSFRVHAAAQPDAPGLQERLVAALDAPLEAPPVRDVRLTFDDLGSPWHTRCEVEADDRHGLLHVLTTAFAAAGASVQSAQVRTIDDRAVDVFELTDQRGAKLDDRAKDAVRRALDQGTKRKRRTGLLRLRRPTKHSGQENATGPKPTGDSAEMPAS